MDSSLIPLGASVRAVRVEDTALRQIRHAWRSRPWRPLVTSCRVVRPFEEPALLLLLKPPDRMRLRAVNSRIEHVEILELSGAPHAGLPKRALVAHGIRADRQFRGDFSDELFGVFVVNDSLTRIMRVLEILPTPRWQDYVLRIERVTIDSVRVVGKGATYGDGERRWVYAW